MSADKNCRRLSAWTVLLGLGTVAATIIVAGGVHARPLEDELALLLEKHPQIREARNLMKSAGHEVDRAFAPFLPSLSLTTNKGFEYVDSPARRASPGDPSRLSNEQATLELSYNLFDGFAKDAGYRIAETGADIAELNYENTKQSIMFVGIRTYWQLRLALKQLQIDRLAEATAKEQLDGLLETEGAQSTEIDTIRSKGRYYTARSTRISSENQVTDLESEYERVFGHRPTPETMQDLPDISGRIPSGLEEALEIALHENPAFKSSRREIMQADESVRQAEASYYPSLSVVGTANWESNLDATRGIGRDLNIVLRGTWQLFDGFATSAGVGSAAAQRAAAKNRNRFTYRQVVQDVTRTWNQIELNRNQVEVWENSVENAEAAIDGLESLVEQGRETRLAVLDGKVELFNTKRQLNQFTGLKELAQYRLMLILGWLTPDILIDAAAPSISPLLSLPSDTTPSDGEAQPDDEQFRVPGSSLPDPLFAEGQSQQPVVTAQGNKSETESTNTVYPQPIFQDYLGAGASDLMFTNDVNFGTD